MHFVAIKPEAQQAQAMLFHFHTRDLLVRQRTQTINPLRGHLAELGVVAPQGRARIAQLAGVIGDEASGLPEAVVELGQVLLWRITELDEKIDELDRKIRTSAREKRRDGAPDDDPGHRAGHRDGHLGLRPADGELPAQTRLLGLAGPRAAAAHDRLQTKAGQDIEDGPEGPEAPVASHDREGPAEVRRARNQGSRGPFMIQPVKRPPCGTALATSFCGPAIRLTLSEKAVSVGIEPYGGAVHETPEQFGGVANEVLEALQRILGGSCAVHDQYG